MCQRAFISRGQSSGLSMSREDGVSFPSPENDMVPIQPFYSVHLWGDSCLLMTVSRHREQQALQKSPVKITTPLVPQKRLLKITTSRISLRKAWQFGNKRPSTHIGLKSSLVSLLEEWAFVSSVTFLYSRWSKSWKILSCSDLRTDRNSRPLSPVLSLLCLSTGLVKLLRRKKYSAWRLLHTPFSREPLHWNCQGERMQLAPKELWF